MKLSEIIQLLTDESVPKTLIFLALKLVHIFAQSHRFSTFSMFYSFFINASLACFSLRLS